MIPVYYMEEHNEAFYYWGLAIEEGYLPEKGNVLFHVDHHDDLECGGYHWDFTKPFADLEERKKFTYEKLGIADFIVPALYEGIFTELYNMKSLLPHKFKCEERYVRRRGKNELSMGVYIPFVHGSYRNEEKGSGEKEYRFFSYFEGSLENTKELENAVLDIDLDYFCWDDGLQSVPPKRIEITRDAYEEYMKNPYHSFRILPRRLIVAEKADGRYFLRYEEPPVYQKAVSEDRVCERIERFAAWLQAVPWKPALITICRSAHSGYLPVMFAELAEEKVRNSLKMIYEIEDKNI